jgi:hypothetical protein
VDVAVSGVTPGQINVPPVITPVNLGNVLLRRWIVHIPNGHNATTGVALQLNGVNIVPFQDSQSIYIVGNNITYEFDVNAEVDQGLQVAQLNLDRFQHAHYMQFEYTPIAVVSTPAPAPAMIAIA